MAQRIKGHNMQKRQVLVIWDDEVKSETTFHVVSGLSKDLITMFQNGAHNQFVWDGLRTSELYDLEQLLKSEKHAKEIKAAEVAFAGPFDYVLICGVRKVAA